MNDLPIITKDSHETEISLSVSQTVTIRLPENPTTGYEWVFIPFDQEGVALIEDEFVPASQIHDRVGVGGAHSFTLQGRRVGRYTISLKHWRSWEGDRSIVDLFSIILCVAAN